MNQGRLGTALAAAVLLAISATKGAHAAARTEPMFPYIDNNNNGSYDAGIDSGDATAALGNGLFHIDGSGPTAPGLVIPKGVSVALDGISVDVPGNITVDGDILSTAGVKLRSGAGSISVGTGSVVTADGLINIDARRNAAFSVVTIVAGMPAGPTMLYHVVSSNPGRPVK